MSGKIKGHALKRKQLYGKPLAHDYLFDWQITGNK